MPHGLDEGSIFRVRLGEIDNSSSILCFFGKAVNAGKRGLQSDFQEVVRAKQQEEFQEKVLQALSRILSRVDEIVQKVPEKQEVRAYGKVKAFLSVGGRSIQRVSSSYRAIYFLITAGSSSRIRHPKT